MQLLKVLKIIPTLILFKVSIEKFHRKSKELQRIPSRSSFWLLGSQLVSEGDLH